jgi:hypothetical protein
VLTKINATDYNTNWQTPASGITDAPNDANAYVRSALAWVVGYTKAAIDTLLGSKADTSAMNAADNLRITTVTLTVQTTSGNYVKSANLKFLEVICIGGGGGTVNLTQAPASQNITGSGGGAGGVSVQLYAASALAASEAYAVAAAGPTGGGTGGTSTFKSQSAGGGIGGGSSGAGGTASFVGGGAGGSASGGLINSPGEQGEAGVRCAHGLAAFGYAGAGGGNMYATRVAAAYSSGVNNGVAGNGWGGGARGSLNGGNAGASNGAAGGAGAIIFREYF